MKCKCKTPLERDFHNPQKKQSLLKVRSPTKITDLKKETKLKESLQYNEENGQTSKLEVIEFKYFQSEDTCVSFTMENFTL